MGGTAETRSKARAWLQQARVRSGRSKEEGAERGEVGGGVLVENDGGGGLLFGLGGCDDASLDRVEGTAAMGAGFDGAEGLALAVERMEEPVAEANGADGPDLVAGEAQSSRSWTWLGLLGVAE